MLVTIDDVHAAATRIGDRVVRTRTLPLRVPELDTTVWVKAELEQHTGSFKLRGVWNTLLSIELSELRGGVCATSAGNHAAALAFAATALGVPSTIVMPAQAVRAKVEATERYGGRVILTDRPLDEVLDEVLTETGAALIHPFDDPRIIAGAAGVALELIADSPPLDLLVVPVGGGGLVSGMAVACAALSPSTRIVGVESRQAPTATGALAAGEPVLVGGRTLADGLCPPSVGPVTLEHLRSLVSEVVCFDDGELAAGLRVLHGAGLRAEPSGAAALASLIAGRVAVRPGERVGCVVSGGNSDPATIEMLLAS